MFSNTGEIVLQDMKIYFQGGRIIVTYGTGELLIRSARHDDSLPTYSCLTIHALTQERKRSQAARLTVIGKWIFLTNSRIFV